MTTITLNVPDNTAQAYMEAVALFTQNPAPETIANFRFSENIEKRIDELVIGNDNDDLGKAEQVELQRLMQLEAQLQLVKAKAVQRVDY